ncbi:MAG: DUF1015 domain-containing protein [Caldimicrobium sp.]|nr:DUF1015 domain-containing protein [Caldimicrobium sp.]MCX7612898.1 DUF1015 domain-containing protein [Caldimicrobium sp.]MDW8094666.1 DUF1015 domain-containing protein [Caldimicrobium sp.]
MPECRPFCGYFYNLEKVDLQSVLAPPYDVVTQEEVIFYKNKSPYNIFHLELPESPQKAKILLESFLREGILIQNQKPSIYYHETTFNYEGKDYLRKGLILLVKLHEFSEEIIIPHERTFQKVTNERFELLKSTSFQFSQIHSVYEDENLYLFRFLPSVREFPFEVTLNETTQRLAKIQDPKVIEKITSFLRAKKLYIADGHHRYITALQYRSFMQKKIISSKDLDFNYMAMYVSPLEDENLLMLPTHRLYYSPPVDKFLEGIKNYTELLLSSCLSEAPNLLKSIAYQSEYFVLVHEERIFLYKFKRSFLDTLSSHEPELCHLPLFNFLKVFELALGILEADLKDRKEVRFVPQLEEVLKEAKGEAFGILFPKVSAKILKLIANRGKLMPHKSTYFYPKILTGMVISEISGKELP